MVDKALDLGDIFFVSLDGIDAHCRRVVAMTRSLSLSYTASATLLMILIFFVRLALMSRLLMRRINKGRISGLSLFEVFLLFLFGLVPSGVS